MLSVINGSKALVMHKKFASDSEPVKSQESLGSYKRDTENGVQVE